MCVIAFPLGGKVAAKPSDEGIGELPFFTSSVSYADSFPSRGSLAERCHKYTAKQQFIQKHIDKRDNLWYTVFATIPNYILVV